MERFTNLMGVFHMSIWQGAYRKLLERGGPLQRHLRFCQSDLKQANHTPSLLVPAGFLLCQHAKDQPASGNTLTGRKWFRLEHFRMDLRDLNLKPGRCSY